MTPSSSTPRPRVIELPSEPRSLSSRILARGGKWWRSVRFRRSMASFGADSDIATPSFIDGARHISIGRSVWIWRGARLEAMGPPELTPKIEIGDGCKFHPGLHIGAVESVRIGRGVLMAANVYVSDHDHDFSDPFDPVVSNGRVSVAPVSIDDYVWLGEQVMVLKGVHIGERSIIGAGSVVTRDVPPFSIAVGSPARIVRRYDRDAQAWVDPAVANADVTEEPS